MLEQYVQAFKGLGPTIVLLFFYRSYRALSSFKQRDLGVVGGRRVEQGESSYTAAFRTNPSIIVTSRKSNVQMVQASRSVANHNAADETTRRSNRTRLLILAPFAGTLFLNFYPSISLVCADFPSSLICFTIRLIVF